MWHLILRDMTSKLYDNKNLIIRQEKLNFTGLRLILLLYTKLNYVS